MALVGADCDDFLFPCRATLTSASFTSGNPSQPPFSSHSCPGGFQTAKRHCPAPPIIYNFLFSTKSSSLLFLPLPDDPSTLAIMNSGLSSLDSQAAGVWDGLKDSILSPPISRENSRSFSVSPGWNLNSSITNSTIHPSTKPWNMHRNLSNDFNPTPGARPSHSDASSDDYWARYHQLKSLDNYKNSLIEVTACLQIFCNTLLLLDFLRIYWAA